MPTNDKMIELLMRLFGAVGVMRLRALPETYRDRDHLFLIPNLPLERIEVIETDRFVFHTSCGNFWCNLKEYDKLKEYLIRNELNIQPYCIPITN